MSALVRGIEKFFMAIPMKTYGAAIGAVAYAVYQATQGNYNEAILAVLAALGVSGVRSAVTKSTEELSRITEDQTAHLSKVTIETSRAAQASPFNRTP